MTSNPRTTPTDLDPNHFGNKLDPSVTDSEDQIIKIEDVLPMDEIRDCANLVIRPGVHRDASCPDAEDEFFALLAKVENLKRNPNVSQLLEKVDALVKPQTLRAKYTEVEMGRLKRDSQDSILDLAAIMALVRTTPNSKNDLVMTAEFIESDLGGAVLATPDNLANAHIEKFSTDPETIELLSHIQYHTDIHEPTLENMPEEFFPSPNAMSVELPGAVKPEGMMKIQQYAKAYNLGKMYVREISLSAAIQSAIVQSKFGKKAQPKTIISNCRGPRGGNISVISAPGKLIQLKEETPETINPTQGQPNYTRYSLVRELKI